MQGTARFVGSLRRKQHPESAKDQVSYLKRDHSEAIYMLLTNRSV